MRKNASIILTHFLNVIQVCPYVEHVSVPLFNI